MTPPIAFFSSLMASTLYVLLTLFIFLSVSESGAPVKPNALVLPVQKDNATTLHVAYIQKRTPLLPIPLFVDLNGRFLWLNCEQNYLSSTYRAPFCHSTICASAGTHYCHKCNATVARPGCHNNTCGVITTNPMTHKNAVGELAQDVLSIQSTRGSNPGPRVTVPRFLFACAPSTLLTEPLPTFVQGVAGLGYSPIALPLQLSSHFGFPTQFAMCLSSARGRNGAIFFGNTTYRFLPGTDVSVPVGAYTPLTISPQGEYYVQVRSISINNKAVPFNTTTRPQGFFTQISTTQPYTVLEHSLFSAFAQFFANESGVPPLVNPVSPFGLCFNSTNLTSTRLGPRVPNIDFAFYNRYASWRIFGANSIYEARPGVSCLAFMDGGLNPRVPIVLGLYQFEDNLLQFDLARSRLGFSSSLLSQRTNCANFNFTSSPSP